MTNAEKYLKDNVSVEEFIKKIADYKPKLETSDNVYAKMQEFFNEQVKPTLTEDERVILRNIAKHSDFEKIGRDKIGGLYVTCRINLPTEEKWTISFYDHLFQFIKERRRI